MQSSRTPTPRRRQVQQAAMMQQNQNNKRHESRTRNPQIERENNLATPLLLKILLWLGIILLCFVLGYLATSWGVDFLNRKLLLSPENRIENQEDLSNFESAEQERITQENLKNGLDVKQVSLNLYHVLDDSIGETRQNFVMKTQEENIADAVIAAIKISLSEFSGVDSIKMLHVFRGSADTIFLDMSGQFASALERIGQRQSLLLMTGIVRTVQENFSPVSQIRFLIDSKPPKSGGVVNLSAPWKMPKKS